MSILTTKKWLSQTVILPSIMIGAATTAFANTIDKILYNGTVLTMNAENQSSQSVAIHNGRIVAVGTSQDILQLKSPTTELIDLQGKTVVPGFIDGHSHFMGIGKGKRVNISPPPMGPVSTIADIITALKNFQVKENIQKEQWIEAFGYDIDQLAEQRHPTKEDLDQAFPDNPVVLTHASGHMLVANSAALKLSVIDEKTADPPGGIIVRKANSNEPTGLLQETAMRYIKRGKPTPVTWQDQLQALKDQQALYASVGITTAQDGYTSLASLETLKRAAAEGALYIDIVSLPGHTLLETILNEKKYQFGHYSNHLKLAGFKVTADGSPQGKTAFFSRPYLTAVPGCNHEGCTGQPTLTQEQLDQVIEKGFQLNIHPFVHCNGDAAVDMYIKAVERANSLLNVHSKQHRPVVIHSQFVRPDQLDKYKQLGFVPSFFTNHTFFWGDVHVRNLGQERAFFSSPLKTALAKDIIFTNHTDYGVTPISQLLLLGTSVNRLSRSNVVIGPEQRVTPLEGLRALTINGAYQYFEENEKGSIEKGKLADLVILSDNPLTVDPLTIKDIKVVETIKEGKTIFKLK